MSNHSHDQGTSKGLEIQVTVLYDAVDLAVTKPFFVANRRYKCTGIVGRLVVAGAGGACTAVIRRAPSGTAAGAGTLLHTGSYNLVGSVDTNQTLTLSATAADLELAAGDSLHFILTGTPTAAIGCVTVFLVPN